MKIFLPFFLTFFFLFPSKASSFCLWNDCCSDGNCINGIGTYEWENGDEYTGEWKDGKRNGKGTFIENNGVVYKGSWRNDKKHGKGIEKKLPELYVYEGDFIEGKRNGKGTAYYGSKNNWYKGEWKDGKRDGIGTMVWTNSEGKIDRYEGEWKDDQREGKGSRYYENGIVYVGEWKNNLRNGEGTLYFLDGSTYKGKWKDGKLLPKYENIRKEAISLPPEKENEDQTQYHLQKEKEKKTFADYKYFKNYCPDNYKKIASCTKSGRIYTCIANNELGEGLSLREAVIQACF